MQNTAQISQKVIYPYLPILEAIGLNPKEAQIYELLLKSGPTGIKPLLLDTGLKRGNAYYHLESLISKGLAEKVDLPGQTIKFSARHPENLELILARQKAAVFSAEENLKKELPQMRSLFQLISTKPGVKFYEGLEGALQTVKDSLTSSTEILSYIDSEAVNKQFPDLNKQFILQRKQKQINKRIIAPDSPFIHKHAKELDPKTTQIKTISTPSPFSTIMYIYDNKVSYISMEAGQIVSMIIEHPKIYQMHKALFETMWQNAKAA